MDSYSPGNNLLRWMLVTPILEGRLKSRELGELPWLRGAWGAAEPGLEQMIWLQAVPSLVGCAPFRGHEACCAESPELPAVAPVSALCPEQGWWHILVMRPGLGSQGPSCVLLGQ